MKLGKSLKQGLILTNSGGPSHRKVFTGISLEHIVRCLILLQVILLIGLKAIADLILEGGLLIETGLWIGISLQTNEDKINHNPSWLKELEKWKVILII
jgi:hypothetical protein